MSAPRLFVTGAGGFVGSWILRLAARAGWEVHGLVRSIPVPGRLDDVMATVSLHRADLQDAPAVEEILRRLQPDFVVHAAFPAAHASGALARRGMFDSGVGGTVNLLEAVRVAGSVKRMLLVGSAMVYGPARQPHDPADALRPTTFRGVCKASASLLCRQFAAETGIICSEARLFTVYGPWEQPNRLVPRLLHAAVEGRTIELTAESRLRNWIYAADAAEACLAAFADGVGQDLVYNAGTDEVRTTHDVAHLLEEIVGRKLIGGYGYAGPDAYGDTNPRGRLPDPADGILWRPQVTLAEGLRAAWAWAQTSAGRRHLGGRLP